ncbi:unnamed protein product [Sphagnum jensenii]|uniref:Uncharacterized protein n=1 Tax=Sphagnum jensenii TaxID=128206 RepID=A0ABP1AUA0_9BRYO
MSRIGCPEGVKLLVTNGWEDAHEDAPADAKTRLPLHERNDDLDVSIYSFRKLIACLTSWTLTFTGAAPPRLYLTSVPFLHGETLYDIYFEGVAAADSD